MKRRISKPIGVYVLTILIFLGLGVFQFLKYFELFRNAEEDVPLTIVFISLFLAAFTAGAAVWSYFGDNAGRITLLVFVSLNVLWAVFWIITEISYQATYRESVALWFNLGKALAWLGVYWWYFTKKSVVAYYTQDFPE
ncbi:MAG: hypothetical protein R2747_24485 [Pyrinomonadaceae bacterium]